MSERKIETMHDLDNVREQSRRALITPIVCSNPSSSGSVGVRLSDAAEGCLQRGVPALCASLEECWEEIGRVRSENERLVAEIEKLGKRLAESTNPNVQAVDPELERLRSRIETISEETNKLAFEKARALEARNAAEDQAITQEKRVEGLKTNLRILTDAVRKACMQWRADCERSPELVDPKNFAAFMSKLETLLGTRIATERCSAAASVKGPVTMKPVADGQAGVMDVSWKCPGCSEVGKVRLTGWLGGE